MKFIRSIFILHLLLYASFGYAQSPTNNFENLNGELWSYESFCAANGDTIVEQNSYPFATITFGPAMTYTLNYNINYNDPKKERQDKKQTGSYEFIKNKKPGITTVKFNPEQDKFPFLSDVVEKNNYGLIISIGKTCFLRFVKEN